MTLYFVLSSHTALSTLDRVRTIWSGSGVDFLPIRLNRVCISFTLFKPCHTRRTQHRLHSPTSLRCKQNCSMQSARKARQHGDTSTLPPRVSATISSERFPIVQRSLNRQSTSFRTAFEPLNASWNSLRSLKRDFPSACRTRHSWLAFASAAAERGRRLDAPAVSKALTYVHFHRRRGIASPGLHSSVF